MLELLMLACVVLIAIPVGIYFARMVYLFLNEVSVGQHEPKTDNCKSVIGTSVCIKEDATKYKNEGRYRKAMLLYEQVIEYNPNDHESLCNYGYCWGKLGKTKRAVDYIEKAVKLRNYV